MAAMDFFIKFIVAPAIVAILFLPLVISIIKYRGPPPGAG